MGPKGENDRPVEVMNAIQQEKDEGYEVYRVWSHKEKHNKHDQGGELHYDPSKAVRDHGSPVLS